MESAANPLWESLISQENQHFFFTKYIYGYVLQIILRKKIAIVSLNINMLTFVMKTQFVLC